MYSNTSNPKAMPKAEFVTEEIEGEESDFVNLEVVFAYQTHSDTQSLKDSTTDTHLYLSFYLPGNIKIPVKIDLLRMRGTMRVRLLPCSDPPFFSLCTFTLMHQPKLYVRCLLLSKHGLNLMSIPLIRSFIQSAINAVVSEYITPKSCTLNLKDMLAGAHYKKE
jgi:Ca2+-dependent lipid-binding protein